MELKQAKFGMLFKYKCSDCNALFSHTDQIDYPGDCPFREKMKCCGHLMMNPEYDASARIIVGDVLLNKSAQYPSFLYTRAEDLSPTPKLEEKKCIKVKTVRRYPELIKSFQKYFNYRHPVLFQKEGVARLYAQVTGEKLNPCLDRYDYLELDFNDIIETITNDIVSVLELRYQFNLTLEHCASVLNITRERVRHRIAKGLRLLQHPTRIRRLRKCVFGFNERLLFSPSTCLE